MGPYNPVKSILPKCCKLGFIHRNCLMEYAESAGYYLKCILCRSTEFRSEVRKRGVFVPDRDAQWELEKGAFSEIYFSQKFCDITNCACPFGRKYVDTGKWKIFKCIHCGATGTHKACFEMLDMEKGFECFQCRKIVYKNNLEMSMVTLDETLDVRKQHNDIFTEKLQALRETFKAFILKNPAVAEAYIMLNDTDDIDELSIPELERNVFELADDEKKEPSVPFRKKRKIELENMRSYVLSRFLNNKDNDNDIYLNIEKY